MSKYSCGKVIFSLYGTIFTCLRCLVLRRFLPSIVSDRLSLTDTYSAVAAKCLISSTTVQYVVVQYVL